MLTLSTVLPAVLLQPAYYEGPSFSGIGPPDPASASVQVASIVSLGPVAPAATPAVAPVALSLVTADSTPLAARVPTNSASVSPAPSAGAPAPSAPDTPSNVPAPAPPLPLSPPTPPGSLTGWCSGVASSSSSSSGGGSASHGGIVVGYVDELSPAVLGCLGLTEDGGAPLPAGPAALGEGSPG